MRRPRRIARSLPPLLLAATPLAQEPLLDEPHRMVAGASGWTSAFEVADLTGDGAPDVLEGNDTTAPGTAAGALALLAGSGTGGFATAGASFPDVGTRPEALATLDADLDGDLDVVVGRTEFESGAFGSLTAVGDQNLLLLSDGALGFGDGTAGAPALDDNTYDLEVADLNGDGLDDVYVVNEAFLVPPTFTANNDDRVWLGDGAGGFQEIHPLPLSTFEPTYHAEVEDVDGDGDLDVLVSNSSTTALDQLLLNDGSASFADGAANLPGPSGFSAVAFADVDGDGDADVAGSETLWLNDGVGTFTDASAAIPAPRPSTAVAAADVDGDGHVDVLSVSALPEIDDGLLLGDGQGGFADGTHLLPSEETNAVAVRVVDVEGDGDADVLLGTKGPTLLWLSNGGGVLADTHPVPRMPGAYSGALADLNADGMPDVFLGTGGAQHDGLYLSDGTGGLVDSSASLPFDDGASRAVEVGDLDGDGDPDVVLANGMWQQNRLFLNDGLGAFADGTAGLPPSSSHTHAARAADLDGDGDLDLLFGNTGYTAPSFYWTNQGGGTFADASLLLPSWIGDRTTAIQVLDVDLDGDLDPVFLNEFSNAKLYPNLPGPGFGSSQDHGIAGGGDMALGDVDADGLGDLLVVGAADGLYLGDGLGSFTDGSAGLPGTTGESEAVALGDVDGDGDLDAYVGNDGADALLLGDGAGGFADGSALLPADGGAWTFGLDLADVDGDGDLDVLAAMLTGESRLLVNRSRHVAWRELPRIAKPLTLDVSGDPGQPWILAVSGVLAPGPLPPWGTLWLSLPHTLVVGSGSLDGEGRAAPTFAVPRVAGWVGTTWFWQALVGTPLRFTNVEPATFTDL